MIAMRQRIVGRRKMIAALVVSSVALITFAACNQGSTDGQDLEQTGFGEHPVSDGGFGAKLTIETEGKEIPTAGRIEFHVHAVDPQGLPLAFRRVFCESEKGIAILEPSSGGVAFEHTNINGYMSGVLGGVFPGSFLLECRLEEGFNLVARKSFRVVGDVPPGFLGFPGAAGGNLGGGVVIENPDQEPRPLTVEILAFPNSTVNGQVDISQSFDCSGNGRPGENAGDIEPFGFDNYRVTIKNPTNEPVLIREVKFIVHLTGSDVESGDLGTTITVDAAGQGSTTGTFTEFTSSGSKTFVTTNVAVPLGTYNVEFVATGEGTLSGDDFRVEGSVAATFGHVDNCDQ